MKKSVIFLLLITLFLLGCSTGFRRSRQVTFDEPPCYKEFKQVDLSSAKIGYLPVQADKRTNSKKSAEAIQQLLDVLNTSLKNNDHFISLPAVQLKPSDAPDVFVGNADMFSSPTSPTINDEDGNGIPEMQLYTFAPSADWKAAIKNEMKEVGTDYTLFIMLGMSEYLVSQKSWLGKKELVLGTGYTFPVKWMTSLDDPVEVLHLTGALMDTSGKILHAGAEGMLAAKSANLLQSAIGLQNQIDPEMFQDLSTSAKRDDLENSPLICDVALWNLIGRLTNNNSLIRQ